MSVRHRHPGAQQVLASPGTVITVAAMVLVLIILPGCGTAQMDANEPNDELNSATVLEPGVEIRGVTAGPKDSDIFRCEIPPSDTPTAFTITVLSAAPQNIDVQVGASIPGVWEGITWPGWKPRTSSDRLEVDGSLKAGTVLVFLKGKAGTAYSIRIAWN